MQCNGCLFHSNILYNTMYHIKNSYTKLQFINIEMSSKKNDKKGKKNDKDKEK